MIIHSEQEMLEFAKSFAATGPAQARIIELIGDVGAGKTTFVRGLAKGLGIKEPVTSPSFTISKTYALPTGGHFIHYDFYRLSDPGLMRDQLKEALIDDKNIIVVEWGNSVKNILPKNRTIINVIYNEDGSREVKVENNRESIFRDISRPTGSELARSPVTTGATKRVEKDTFRLFLDTSTPETILKLNDKEYREPFANDLAEKLLKFIHDKLAENHKTWTDLTEITFMSGPGSFTGLRIGASLVNTLASELNIPLYDHQGKKHKIILPDYGRGANISKPKK